METTTFTYQYSAQESREAEAIRKKYMPKEMDKLARLRSLDKQVQMAGVIVALSLGIIGVLLFGVAVCHISSVLSVLSETRTNMRAVGSRIRVSV